MGLSYNWKYFKLKKFNRLDCLQCHQYKPNVRYFRDRNAKVINKIEGSKGSSICEDCLPQRTTYLDNFFEKSDKLEQRLIKTSNSSIETSSDLIKAPAVRDPNCLCSIKNGFVVQRCADCMLKTVCIKPPAKKRGCKPLDLNKGSGE